MASVAIAAGVTAAAVQAAAASAAAAAAAAASAAAAAAGTVASAVGTAVGTAASAVGSAIGSAASAVGSAISGLTSVTVGGTTVGGTTTTIGGLSLPQILTGLSIAGSAAGAGVQIAGTIQTAEAARQASKFAAKALGIEGKRGEERERKKNRRRLESSRARFIANAGLRLEGSPLDALANAASEFERNAINIRRSAGQASDIELAKAKSIARAGKIGAAAAALQGLGQTTQVGLQLARF